MLIMRREAAVLIAPKPGKVQKMADLANGMLGIAGEGPIDGALLGPVLEYYGIPRDKAKYTAMPSDALANALRQKKIDAVLVVGPIASKQVSEVVAEIARGAKGAINFIEIEEADAISKRIPALEKLEVEQGAFGGRPPRPAESFSRRLPSRVRLVATPQKRRRQDRRACEAALSHPAEHQRSGDRAPGLMETPDLDEPTPFSDPSRARAPM